MTAVGATSEAQQTFVEPAVEATTESTEIIELEAIAQQPVQHTELEPSAELKSSRFDLSDGADVITPTQAEEPQPTLNPEPEPAPDVEEPALAANLAGQSKPQGNKVGWFARLKQGLAKTSSSLGEGMASLFLGKKKKLMMICLMS